MVSHESHRFVCLSSNLYYCIPHSIFSLFRLTFSKGESLILIKGIKIIPIDDILLLENFLLLILITNFFITLSLI